MARRRCKRSSYSLIYPLETRHENEQAHEAYGAEGPESHDAEADVADGCVHQLGFLSALEPGGDRNQGTEKRYQVARLLRRGEAASDGSRHGERAVCAG